MATIVNLDRSASREAEKVAVALVMIRQGIGDLKELDGLRAEAIGDGAATVAQIFGVEDNAQAQALSDRISAFLAAFDDGANAEFAKIRDLVNAFNG